MIDPAALDLAVALARLDAGHRVPDPDAFAETGVSRRLRACDRAEELVRAYADAHGLPNADEVAHIVRDVVEDASADARPLAGDRRVYDDGLSVDLTEAGCSPSYARVIDRMAENR